MNISVHINSMGRVKPPVPTIVCRVYTLFNCTKFAYLRVGCVDPPTRIKSYLHAYEFQVSTHSSGSVHETFTQESCERHEPRMCAKDVSCAACVALEAFGRGRGWPHKRRSSTQPKRMGRRSM